MEEVTIDEDKPSDSDDSDIVSDNVMSDSGESVEDSAEDVLPAESSDSEQPEDESVEQSGEGSAGESESADTGEETESSSEEPEEEESGTGESEPGTEEEESEETTESGTEEGTTEETTESGTEEGTTEEVTEEITEPGIEDSKEAGTVEQTGSIYTGTLADYLAEIGIEETGEITACMEVVHQDLVQVHTDLQLIATYLTGFVVLTAFYFVYKLFRIFF